MSDYKPLEEVVGTFATKNTDPNYIYWKFTGDPTTIPQNGAVNDIAFQPVAPYNFAIASSLRVKVFDTNWQEKRSYNFKDKMWSVNYNKDGKSLVCGGEDGQIKLLLPDMKAISSATKIYKGHTGSVRYANFCNNDDYIFSASDDKAVKVWDKVDERCLNTFRSHTDKVRCGAVAKNDPYCIITGSYDNTARVFDTRSNQEVFKVDHKTQVDCVLAFPNKSLLFTAGDTSIKVWDMVYSGRLLYEINSHHKNVMSIKFNNDYTRLLSAGLDGHVKVYELETYQPVSQKKYPEEILCMDVSPDDDKYLAVGCKTTLSIRERKNPVMEKKVTEESKALLRAGKDKRKRATIIRSMEFPAQKGDHVINYQERNQQEMHDQLLRQFKHKKAFKHVMTRYRWTKKPEISIAVLEELIRRNVLTKALKVIEEERKPKNNLLIDTLKFLAKYITNPNYTNTLEKVASSLIDMYAPMWDELEDNETHHFTLLQRATERSLELAAEMSRLMGCIDLIMSNRDLMTPPK